MRQRRGRLGSRSRNTSYDGHLHARDAKVVGIFLTGLALSILPLALYWLPVWQVSLGILLGAWLGWWLTPDIDHTNSTQEEYRAMRKLGVLGAIWVGMWTPYAYLFKHRSIWSHSIIGTAIRFGMIFLVCFLFWLVVMKSIFGLEFPWSWGYVSCFIAYTIQDMVHYMRDEIGPFGLTRRRSDGASRWTAGLF